MYQECICPRKKMNVMHQTHDDTNDQALELEHSYCAILLALWAEEFWKLEGKYGYLSRSVFVFQYVIGKKRCRGRERSGR